jgi:hypothetical protein
MARSFGSCLEAADCRIGLYNVPGAPRCRRHSAYLRGSRLRFGRSKPGPGAPPIPHRSQLRRVRAILTRNRVVAAFDSTSVRHAATVPPSAGSRTSGPRYWRTSPYRRPVGGQGRCCAEFTRGSRLRRESVRVGWSMSILPRRRLVCRTLSGDTARLRSMLKPDSRHFGLWIHDHGSPLRRTARRRCTARESAVT